MFKKWSQIQFYCQECGIRHFLKVPEGIKQDRNFCDYCEKVTEHQIFKPEKIKIKKITGIQQTVSIQYG